MIKIQTDSNHHTAPPEAAFNCYVSGDCGSTTGLALLVEQELEISPFLPALFVFCNRQRNKVKILYWERNGFVLWSSPCDETSVQVLNAPRRPAHSSSYMWVQVATLGTPVILFDYDPSRGGHVPERLLSGYQGYLQTDGYSGYNSLSDQDDIIQQGCWAHARRKFDEAIKAQGLGRKGKSKGKKPATMGKAQVALNYIRKLYRIEHEIADLPVDQKHQRRLQCSRPILDYLRQWLEKALPETLRKSSLGKALHYLYNQWKKLVRYCDAGYLRMDNNLAENAIRPFVIGRKNWLFSASQAGAHASANLYSLVETAKANGLEPWRYLMDILTALPTTDSVEKLEVLLPWNAGAVSQGGEK